MLAITNFLPYEKPPVGDFSGEIIRYSGNFVKMYFAERCACYPYIFPTIFPRAAAGMLIWLEYTASQGGCLY